MNQAIHQKGLFITGTDTGVGKTYVTVRLMRELQGLGACVVGMKPVATGAFREGGRLVNEDALALQHAGSVVVPYEWINPFVFEPPVSPHIAARLAGQEIDLARISEVFGRLAESADLVLVEGVGGWQVPLGEDLYLSGMARALDLPVVLVVGLRLGCLNHALLTSAAIEAEGVGYAGWIANCVDSEFLCATENIETLKRVLPAPFWGCLPFASDNPPARSDLDGLLDKDEILRVLGA